MASSSSMAFSKERASEESGAGLALGMVVTLGPGKRLREHSRMGELPASPEMKRGLMKAVGRDGVEGG
jgi:hypothetical protein